METPIEDENNKVFSYQTKATINCCNRRKPDKFHSTSSDELFEGDNAPLFNFSSKIKLCFRLGVIDKEFAECLDLIRKIRNNCAHQIDGCDLNSGSEKDRVTTLVNRLKDYELFKGVLKPEYRLVLRP